MIITRTPLRISLGGGGSDLPGYYREHGGFLVAAAINKYIYVAVHENFEPSILLKYSQIEQVDRLDEIKHPLIREALRWSGLDRAIEISSMADIPAGTGLGSSGSFAVGLLRALHAYKREYVSPTDLAATACRLEIDLLGEPVGKQDQYMAAVGGLTALEFHADDSVTVTSLPGSSHAATDLDENLLLFYTGIRRSAADELRDTGERIEQGSGTVSRNLTAVKQIGRETYDALCAGDLDCFGALLTEQWKLKLARQPSSMHDWIDRLIERGVAAGAAGGKLVGAGGGGFLLFYTHDRARLRSAMADSGMAEVPFRFDFSGSTVIVQ
jgi:D-glycero-alpha-D-manno-heptose-7-phosphate kinase